MALMIATGRSDIWPIKETRPVYWINLERSADSVGRRLQMLCRFFGIRGRHHGITLLHAKGLSLTTIQRKVRRWVESHPTGIPFLDSISRAGQGSMNEDEVANRITDILNSTASTWVALAHTPRGDSDHQFGSIMFDAGEDIGIKLSSETRLIGDTQTLGVSLIIMKANDIPKGQVSYLAFEFADGELQIVRGAEKGEFIKLVLEQARSDEQKVIDYLSEEMKGTATKIAAATGVHRVNVSTILTAGKRFIRIGRDKDGVWYGLKAETF